MYPGVISCGAVRFNVEMVREPGDGFVVHYGKFQGDGTLQPGDAVALKVGFTGVDGSRWPVMSDVCFVRWMRRGGLRMQNCTQLGMPSTLP
jgi:hypothetical protein